MMQPDELMLAYLDSHPGDVARVLERLAPAEVAAFLATVPVRLAAAPMAAMVAGHAGRTLAALPVEQAVALMEALPDDRCAACLRPVEDVTRETILDRLPARVARTLRRQLHHADDRVGAHMHADPVVLDYDATVAEAWAALRGPHRGDCLCIHLVNSAGRPDGSVALAALFDVDGSLALNRLARRNAVPLLADSPLVRIDPSRDWLDQPERPVVDGARRMVGTITLARLLAARATSVDAVPVESNPVGALLRGYGATVGGLAQALARLGSFRAQRDSSATSRSGPLR